MIKQYFFIPLFVLLCGTTYAQKHFFENYSIREGLQSNYAYHVTQSCDGLIVTTTLAGISVLYPNRIKTYSTKDGLPPYSPTGIFPLKDNFLIINYTRGFSILNLNNGEIENFPMRRSKPFSTFSFGDGKLYSMYDSIKSTITKIHVIRDSLVHAARITDVLKWNEKILFSTLAKGVLIYDPEKDSSYQMPGFSTAPPVTSLSSHEDFIYAVTPKGYVVIENLQFSHIESYFDHNSEIDTIYWSVVREFETDDIGNKWYFGEFTGTFHVDDKNVKMLEEKQGFTSSKVNDIFKDKEGNLWFATMGQGLFMYRNDPFTLYNQTSFDLALNNVSAFEKIGKNFVIGYTPGGLEVLDTSEMKGTLYQATNSSLINHNIISLEKYENVVYGLSYNNFFTTNGSELSVIELPQDMNFYHGRNMAFGGGKLYISTAIGILQYALDGNSSPDILYAPPGTDKEVLFIEYFDDQIFFTTNRGLFELKDLTHPKILFPDTIQYRFSLQYEQFSLFCSSEGQCLILNKNTKVVHKSQLTGVLGIIQSIFYNKGYVYIFTDGYYYIFNLDDFVQSQQTIDPLNSNSHGFDIFPNSAKKIGSNIYLGTSEGIMEFSPLPNRTDTISPSIVMNYPVEQVRDNFMFIPKESRNEKLQIYAMDYRSGHKIALSIANQNHTYSSTNNFLEIQGEFRPGKNIITVSATDVNGNETTENWTFQVESYWWERVYARVIMIIILILLVTGIYLIILSLREQRILKREKNKRIVEEQLRESIAMDFHDELGNNLAILNVQIEKLRLKSGSSSVYIPLIEDIRTTYKKIFENSKDLVWALNPASDDLNEIMIRGKDFGERLFRENGIHFFCINKIDASHVPKIRSSAAKDIMYIIKEGFTNAYKHSNATQVVLEINSKGNKHSISIKDNGKGLPVVPSQGRGLRYMKKRVEKIKYTLEVISSGTGTEIKIEGQA